MCCNIVKSQWSFIDNLPFTHGYNVKGTKQVIFKVNKVTYYFTSLIHWELKNW